MEATTALGFVFIVFVGVTFLAILLQFLDPEREPGRQTERKHVLEGVHPAVPTPNMVPTFFAKPLASQVPSAFPGTDDGLFVFLQHHVRAEQAMVAEFVHLPSIDNLYRQARAPLTVN